MQGGLFRGRPARHAAGAALVVLLLCPLSGSAGRDGSLFDLPGWRARVAGLAAATYRAGPGCEEESASDACLDVLLPAYRTLQDMVSAIDRSSDAARYAHLRGTLVRQTLVIGRSYLDPCVGLPTPDDEGSICRTGAAEFIAAVASLNDRLYVPGRG
jgi:hypothetical protein